MTKKQTIFVILGVIVFAVIGWGGGQYQRAERAEKVAAFSERRLALLERDNERLREIVGQMEAAKEAAAEAERRVEVERATARLRQLPFRKPVDYHQMPKSRVKEVLMKKLDEHMGDADFERARLGYVAMGYFDPHYPLKQSYVNLFGEQVAAFYDQHLSKLVMFDHAKLDSLQNRIILCHELTHALQDQHFGLRNLPIEIKDNDDRALAALALAEGDATLVMNLYSAENLSAASLGTSLLEAFGQNVEELAKAPPLLRETLLFPYIAGLDFCTRLYVSGGAAAISKAFARPPSSTTQVLHFEKYLAQEEPLDFAWRDIVLLGEKAETSNVAGELGVKTLLGQWIGLEGAERAAAGWRGDRYVLFAKGNALAWRSAWETSQDAADFVAAIEQMWVQKYGATHLNAGDGAEPLLKSFKATVFGEERILELRILAGRKDVLVLSANHEKWAVEMDQFFSNTPLVSP